MTDKVYYLSLYNRHFDGLSSSGPVDPTDTVFKISGRKGIPIDLFATHAIRCVVSAQGFIVYADTPTVIKSISLLGKWVKPPIMDAWRKCAKPGRVLPKLKEIL